MEDVEEEPVVKLVDSKLGLSLDLSADLEEMMNSSPGQRSGLFFNAVV